MKFDFIKIGEYSHGIINGKECNSNIFGIYITRNEILKNYETNKELFYEKIIAITEMLTTPHCFHTYYWQKNRYDIDEKVFSDFIDKVKKTTTQGVTFFIDNIYGEKDFGIYIVKRR